ncbi:hypothetical protein EV421DRAFT_1748699 [Armillaria borealis]|uniref:Acetyl-CoA hydrolase/transferase C-terminal domain-containing protein n=1 Tax=Armillaria borealis TaxID=47425 RepID=A0AA39M5E7_9AGAR|nr:hypothetical protein EV421DRAFT_1748699 [Armillaria borealis]
MTWCHCHEHPSEVDIYTYANSTNALGSRFLVIRVLNSFGGSADFLRNAKLSIMHMLNRPTKINSMGISYIVPFTLHMDQTGETPKHDLDFVVTEQGLTDLCGLSL